MPLLVGSLISKISLGVAGVAAIGIGAALLFPLADLTARSWFDQPVDGSTLLAGEHDIRLHLREEAKTARVEIVRDDGSQVGALGDDTLVEEADSPHRIAWLAEYTFDFEPGVYTIQPLIGTGDRNFPSVTVTVIDAAAAEIPPAVEEADDGPVPVETSTPEPLEDLPPPPDLDAPPTEAPPGQAPPEPGPQPSTPTTPSTPTFSGTASRVQTTDVWTSTFTVSNVRPSGATVNIEVNVRNEDNNQWTGWTARPCIASSTTAPFTCTVTNYTIPKPGKTSTATPAYQIWFRPVVTTSGYAPWYGLVGIWNTPFTTDVK